MADAAKVFSLDFLLEEAAPAAEGGAVTLRGVEYALRPIASVADFLALVAVCDQRDRLARETIGLVPKGATPADAMDRYRELVVAWHRAIRALAPGIPDAVLDADFGTPRLAMRLGMELVRMVVESSPAAVKNGSSRTEGPGTETATAELEEASSPTG